ncbi:hypothetical protein ACS0TY_014633 [Phlomoides rotata]
MDGGRTPLLDPNIVNPRGRPREHRYVSAVEAASRSRRGGRARPPRSRGRTRVRGVSGGRMGTSRGRSRSAPTMQENNNNAFPFDLNEDVQESYGSFLF